MHSEKFIVDNNGYNANNNFDVNLYNENEFVKTLLEKKRIKDIDHIDTISFQFKVEWSFNLEMRSWGVKNCDAVADEIGDVSCFVTYYDKKNGDDEQEIEFTNIDLSEFTVDTDRHPTDNSGNTKTFFCLESVDIDFEDKTITAYF